MERSTEQKHTLTYAKQPASRGICYITQGTKTGFATKTSCKLEGQDGVGVGKEVQEGGDVCIPMADPC